MRVFLFILLIISLPAAGQYNDVDHKLYMFGGAKFCHMPKALTLGYEVSSNAQLFNRFYIGLSLSAHQGVTTDNYGYTPPDGLSCNFTANIIAIDFSYRFSSAYSDRAFLISCSNGIEYLEIGAVNMGTRLHIQGMPGMSLYYKLNSNLFYSLHPGFRYYRLDKFFMLGANYNFVIGNPSFGKNADFQGFEIVVGVKTREKKKRKYNVYRH